MRILYISSRPPKHSAGLAMDQMKSLVEAGHQVDFLTKFAFEGQESNMYSVYEKSWIDKLVDLRQKYPFLHYLSKLKFLVGRKNLIFNNGIKLTAPDESKPPVAIDDILRRITKEYDLVITLFLQDFISSLTLKAIYEKLKCPIIIRSVDMGPFTGGCYFFLDCERYQHNCGKCPALMSEDENDKSHQNFLIKKSSYASINYAYCCNNWMKRFALKSNMFEPDRIFTSTAVIDETRFYQRPIEECRKVFGIPQNKSFILFARYQNKAIISKGFSHLIDAISEWSVGLSEVEKSKVIVLIAGNRETDPLYEMPVETKYLGQLDTENLIRAYSVANAFVSPSIDDAGPSMVNQSIMCSTPVICYNIGTAIDVIESGKSGFKASDIDSHKLAECIDKLYKLPNEEYQQLRKSTHEIAMSKHSLKSFAAFTEKVYDNIKNRG